MAKLARVIAAMDLAVTTGSTTRNTAAELRTQIDLLPINMVAQLEVPPRRTAKRMRVKIKQAPGTGHNPATGPAKGKEVASSLAQVTAVLAAAIVAHPAEIEARVRALGPVAVRLVPAVHAAVQVWVVHAVVAAEGGGR